MFKQIKHNILSLFHFLLIITMFTMIGCSNNENMQASVNPESFSVEIAGGEISVTLVMDGQVNVSSPSWIENKDITSSTNGQVYKFVVTANLTGKDRSGQIVFTSGASASVTVSQKGGEVYVPSEDLTGVDVSSKQIKPLGGQASDERPTAPFSRVWDGVKNKDVYYSEYSGGRVADFPVKLDLYFDKSLDFVDHIVYYAPTNGILGCFGKTRVLVSKDENAKNDNQFEEVASVDLGMKSGAIQRISIPKVVKGVKTVRLLVEEGGDGAVGALEIEVYTKNLTDFDATVLFTDATCSELKPGITQDKIEAYPFAFFKNIAMHMLKGSYQREFRIGEYKAYQHPSVQSKLNKTTTYSLLDNPTGIGIKEGESLVIMVGDTYGEDISVRITNWDGEQAAVDGYGSFTTHMLNSGINRFENVGKGLMYVMYHTDNFKTAKSIKVHIASGTVNGYYDSSKHSPEQWARLLDAATDKHFDILSEYAHITFPTANLKNISNGQSWLDFYNNLVYEEQVFMGLKKYDRMFNNRMHFTVMYSDAYMYSTSYHTAYSKGTIADLCNLSKIKEECWGLAHEVGHSNQTRPGLKWHGMTEVTNNIKSMYMQYILSQQSRLLKQTKYAKGMTDAFGNASPFMMITRKGSKDVDVFCQLVPLWQLQLYMAYVMGKEDFYKDVYEAVRLEDDKDPKTKSGDIQLDFVYKCCVASGLDLSDFFTKWGFFRELKPYKISDYGDSDYEVTATYIEKTKNDIAALKLPKPKHKFEYITELTESVYKKNGIVKRGSALRSGDVFTMSGWENAVAFEIYDSQGKLIYVSPEPIFTAKDMPNKISVKAIAVDGSQTLVPF